jgi:tetratricopeptide (TPR) repeat protein
MARLPQDTPARQAIADFTLMAGAWHQALTYESIGDDEQAEEAFRYAAANAERAGMRYQQASILGNLAHLLHRRGRHDEAIDALEAARAQFSAIDAKAQAAEADELLGRWRGSA